MEAGSLGAAPQKSGLARLPARSDRDASLHAAAAELEASFLAEMLKSAGFGKPRDSLGGAIGEEQFSSLLVTEQARGMVKAGGIGLTEHLFQALKMRDGYAN